jgi:hypothetical protein
VIVSIDLGYYFSEFPDRDGKVYLRVDYIFMRSRSQWVAILDVILGLTVGAAFQN